MKINWFTVIAQVINFIILVWLLRRFLYKPVLRAVDEREKKIAARLEDASAKKEEARKEQLEFRGKIDAFEQGKKELMDKAVAETDAHRLQLLEQARNEAGKLSAEMEEALKEAQENLNRTIVQKTREEVFAITRKTLNDLASRSLEEQSVQVFISRLQALEGDEKKKFMETFSPGREPALVRSAFALPPEQQDEIKKSITGILGRETALQFKTAPELVSGIELSANGYKLAWSIAEYLNNLKKYVAEQLLERKQPAGEKKTEPGEKT